MRGRDIALGVKLHPRSALSTLQEATIVNLHPKEYETEKAIYIKMVKVPHQQK
jgi:hypothetical protein